MQHRRPPLWWLENLPVSSLNTLFLRLDGMQAWGDRAPSSIRPTFPEPSKSGVVGLLAACLGVNTDEDLRKLSSLITIGVRTDRPGVNVIDFQTIQEAYNTNGDPRLKPGAQPAEDDGEDERQTVTSERHYLHDASFLVAVRAELPGLIERLMEAVQNPFWYVYLGRAACPPYQPIYDGVGNYESLGEALYTHPWYRIDEDGIPFGSYVSVTATVECNPGQGQRRHDEIVSRNLRKYRDRWVSTMPRFQVIVKPIEENPCFKPC